MQLKPLGHRLLIKPDKPPETTESGFVIPYAVDPPPMSGTVVSLGDGPYRERQLKRAVVARCLAILDRADSEHGNAELAINEARNEMQAYMASAEAIGHLVQAGERVIFPMAAGHEIVLGENTEDALLVISEDSILAVCEQEKVEAA
jgi:co-chaperonin GroES (HSP10)